jgi:hypothetical protein
MQYHRRAQTPFISQRKPEITHRVLRSSGMLCGKVWSLVTEISAELIGPIFKVQDELDT